MPLNTKLEKKDSKQMLLDLIAKQYGTSNAVVMEKALKTQDKQIEEAMGQGMGANDIAQSKGIDLSLLDRLIQSSGDVKAVGESQQPQQQALQPQQQPSGQQNLIQKQPASSPFGFGGMNMENGQLVEQQPGLLAGLLSLLVSGRTNTSSQMDLRKLMGASEIQQSKGVYGFDPKTGKVTLQAEVPKGSDVRNMQPTSEEFSALTPEQQTQAYALSRKIAGVRGAQNVLPSVTKSLLQGKNIDQIEDELRFSGQSSEFSSVRNAAQQVMVGKSASEQQSAFDTLDDLQEDPKGQIDFLKRMAIKNSTADQQNLMMGKERTVDFLSEIQGDLDTLEKNGFPTNFFSGNWENLLSKVGQVQNPEMRKVATKIATSIMQYRRSMTGVQFGMLENKEYKRIFPGINKVGEFNKATISALGETFKGDLDKFYSQSMGEKNYKKMLGKTEKQSQLPPGYDPNEWEVVNE